MPTLEERTALWSGLIAEQKSSGLSQAAWCRERNLSFNTFCNWRTRLRKQSVETLGWMSVSPDHAPTPKSSITLRIGAVSIELSSGFDPKLLLEVITALEMPC